MKDSENKGQTPTEEKLELQARTSCNLQNVCTTKPDSERSLSQSGNGSHEESKPQDEAQVITLIKASRTLHDILCLSTCLKFENDKVICIPCANFSKSITTPDSSKVGEFLYKASEYGMDIQESATLPREFRNLKTHIARHLEGDGIHHKAINWTRKQEALQKQFEGENFKAGMTCGRLA